MRITWGDWFQDIDAIAERIWEDVLEIKDFDLIKYAIEKDWLRQDFDTESFIVPKNLDEIRERIFDERYWADPRDDFDDGGSL